MPKGCPRADVARQFVTFCSDPKAAGRLHRHPGLWADQSRRLQDASRPSGPRLLPTSPENLKKMAIANENWWSANRAAVTERFNAWLLT